MNTARNIAKGTNHDQPTDTSADPAPKPRRIMARASNLSPHMTKQILVVLLIHVVAIAFVFGASQIIGDRIAKAASSIAMGQLIAVAALLSLQLKPTGQSSVPAGQPHRRNNRPRRDKITRHPAHNKSKPPSFRPLTSLAVSEVATDTVDPVDKVVEATDARIRDEAIRQLEALNIDDIDHRLEPLWMLASGVVPADTDQHAELYEDVDDVDLGAEPEPKPTPTPTTDEYVFDDYWFNDMMGEGYFWPDLGTFGYRPFCYGTFDAQANVEGPYEANAVDLRTQIDGGTDTAEHY